MRRTTYQNQTKRIEYIDFLRAYAILMMLQGHVVGLLLAEEYADSSLLPYYLWNYMRGVTAPVCLFRTLTVRMPWYCICMTVRS